jgi:DNA-binding MarR family transcriptional regulator
MQYDPLKLENQLCFPLYASAREVVKKYKPFLDKIGLTYTQYIAMMVLWENKSINVKSLGECLYLDSGTLTPLLKKLEAQGLVARARSAEDERNLIVTLTDKGEALKQEALHIPEEIGKCINITQEDAQTLYRILYQILGNL